jgi:prefoldin subunit 5
MTFRSLAALTVLTVTAGTALVAAPASAQTATTPTTLYVSNSPGCTDSPTRTPGQAYCTVQAAADAAQPGQTVLLAPGNHVGAVTLAHSGQPGAPITISGGGSSYPITEGGIDGGSQPALTLNGVHDIVLTSLSLAGTGTVVAVNGGSAISITSSGIDGGTSTATADTPTVATTGSVSGLLISRSSLTSYNGTSLTIGPGASGVSVTSDILLASGSHNIAATDAPGTEVVGDTLFGKCTDQIQLAGASANSVVENDIVTEPTAGSACPAGDGSQISVSAASTGGTTVDYNVVNPQPSVAPYNWGGHVYASPGAFNTDTGQGAHDIQANPKIGVGYRPQPGSPAIDSADGSAPGETTVDHAGNPRVDDPLTPNTGSSQGFYDRGAIEAQDPYAFNGVFVDHTSGTFPLTVTATASVTNPWNDPISSYTWNFGDGTPTVTTTTPTYAHTYTTAAPAGGFTITVTVTSNGTARTRTLTGIQVTEPAPAPTGSTYHSTTPTRLLDTRGSSGTGAPVPAGGTVGVQIEGNPKVPGIPATGVTAAVLNVTVTGTAGSGFLSSWADGTKQPTTSNLNWTGAKQTLSNSVTVPVGADGRVDFNVTNSTAVVVDLQGYYTADSTGATFVGLTPSRILDTRSAIGVTTRTPITNATVDLAVVGRGGVPAGATAAVLNLTATSMGTAGYLEAYPHGGAVPGVSNVNWTGAGSTLAGLAIVPIGALGHVDIQVHGTSHVVADVFGYFTAAGNSTAGNPSAGRFSTTAPTRLLDTRSAVGVTTRTLVPAGSTIALQVVGRGGIPKGVTAVILNVTVTGPTSSGFLSSGADGAGIPTTSNLNWVKGEAISNQVIVPVGADGQVDLHVSGATAVVADVFGYFQ